MLRSSPAGSSLPGLAFHQRLDRSMPLARRVISDLPLPGRYLQLAPGEHPAHVGSAVCTDFPSRTSPDSSCTSLTLSTSGIAYSNVASDTRRAAARTAALIAGHPPSRIAQLQLQLGRPGRVVEHVQPQLRRIAREEPQPAGFASTPPPAQRTPSASGRHGRLRSCTAAKAQTPSTGTSPTRPPADSAMRLVIPRRELRHVVILLRDSASPLRQTRSCRTE